MTTLRFLGMCVLVVGLLATAQRAMAGRTVAPEGWMSAGFVNPDYDPSPLAVARAGLGIRFFDRLSLGASAQVDRDRWFGFAYVGTTLPELFYLETFGRFYVGRRDDISDTATAWSVGVRTGNSDVKLTAEIHGIIQPGHGLGVSIGVSF
jgi:hypothetical protein